MLEATWEIRNVREREEETGGGGGSRTGPRQCLPYGAAYCAFSSSCLFRPSSVNES